MFKQRHGCAQTFCEDKLGVLPSLMPALMIQTVPSHRDRVRVLSKAFLCRLSERSAEILSVSLLCDDHRPS